MNNIVTQQFLRTRFRIVALFLLIVLGGSAAMVTSALWSAAERSAYVATVQRLANAAIRLELDLAALSQSSEGTAEDRLRAHATFSDVLARFLWLAGAQRARAGARTAGGGPPAGHGHLAALAAHFGIDMAADPSPHGLVPDSMSKAFARLWQGQPGSGAVALEDSLARLLRRAAPLVGGYGPLTEAERELSATIRASLGREIRPQLDRAIGVLEGEMEQTRDQAILLVLALTALVAVLALVSLAVIFRPLERAVMRSQGEIIRQRDRAIEADIAKRNFLSVVSHELRTPMNGILGFASLLLTADLKPEHRKQVEIIQSSGKALLALVNDLLDFSRLEGGSLELEDENFSIEDVISGVVVLLRGTAAARHLQIHASLDPGLPEFARGDGARLRQVLTNLVGNAIKFTDSGSICLEACEVSGVSETDQGRALQVSVRDTGIGIPAGQQERIFEQFTQVDRGTRRRIEGTGLGLAICRQLVEMMGGRIWVESQLGVGATFFLRIPLKDAIPPIAESAWHRRAFGRLSGHRVLVVDYDAGSRHVPRRQLESFGMRVDDEPDAVEALRRIRSAADRQDPYEVVVIGHQMPEIDGLDLARRIRAESRLAGVSLLLSRSGAVPDPDEARLLGFDAVEEKPVLPHALIDTLCGLIGAAPPGGCDTGTYRPSADADSAGQQVFRKMSSRSVHRPDIGLDIGGGGRDTARAAGRTGLRS